MSVGSRSVPVVVGGERGEDLVVREEPLEIRVESRSLAVTMRTPGHDRELAAGFLWTEGVVDGADDLISVGHLPGDPAENTVVAVLAGGVEAHSEALDRAARELYATSSCGICGKASLDRVDLQAPAPHGSWGGTDELLMTLPGVLKAFQQLFQETGGAHAAALVASDGTMDVVREDVGRHNAVDKVLGWNLLQDRPVPSDRLLLVSSRAGFEIVQKAAMAGVPAVASIGAASSLAVELAASRGMSLVGFLRPNRFVRYA